MSELKAHLVDRRENIESLKFNGEFPSDYPDILDSLIVALEALDEAKSKLRTLIGHEPFQGLEPRAASEGSLLISEAIAKIETTMGVKK